MLVKISMIIHKKIRVQYIKIQLTLYYNLDKIQKRKYEIK